MKRTLSVPRRVAVALLAVLAIAAPAFGQNFSVIHSFGFLGFDGDIPLGLMQASDGNFYGTTAFGPNHAQGEGTVFRMTGAVTMIHQFHFEAGRRRSPFTAVDRARKVVRTGIAEQKIRLSSGS